VFDAWDVSHRPDSKITYAVLSPKEKPKISAVPAWLGNDDPATADHHKQGETNDTSRKIMTEFL
jgi:hypothetical protein